MDNQKNKCSVCGATFNSHDELMKHAQTAHPMTKDAPVGQDEEQHSIACSKCGFKAKTTEELQEHGCATC